LLFEPHLPRIYLPAAKIARNHEDESLKRARKRGTDIVEGSGDRSRKTWMQERRALVLDLRLATTC
jgi:hypothetical protein